MVLVIRTKREDKIMSNMSYCRFENTAADLDDCVNNWDNIDEDNQYEVSGKDRIIALARQIVQMEGE